VKQLKNSRELTNEMFDEIGETVEKAKKILWMIFGFFVLIGMSILLWTVNVLPPIVIGP